MAIDAAVAREWPDAPPLVADRPIERHLERQAARFHGLRWEPVGDRHSWTGELLWRHPHPVIPGAPCTTHVVLVEQYGHVVMTVRVTADDGLASVRGSVGAGQARPSFLRNMNRTLRLAWEGSHDEPRSLSDEEVEGFVRDVLLSEWREHPVAVVAPLEEGGFVVPPAELVDELLGLAHLYVINRHPITYRLSDVLGDRRLSCYWGALRVYMPEFSCADRAQDHPLLVRDRLLDPVIRADLAGQLALFGRGRAPVPASVAERRRPSSPDDRDAAVEMSHGAGAPPVSSEAPQQSPDATPVGGALAAELASVLRSMPSTLEGVGARLAELSERVAWLVAANAALTEEMARLRTTSAVRAGNTASLERRIDSLERTLLRALSPGEPDAVTPSSLTAT